MLTKQDVEFLRRSAVFAGLRGDVIEQLASHASRIDIDADQLLYREGEPAKEMAVVVTGTLEVIKHTDAGPEVCIATLGPGDVVGEMSLIDIQPRSANVWVRGPASLVVLKHVDLASLYQADQQSYTLLVLNISREISIRLRRLDAMLANVMGQIQAVTCVRDESRNAPTSNK